MASGSGIDDMGTEFEKSIYQLIVEDCDPGNNSSFPSKVFPSPFPPVTQVSFKYRLLQFLYQSCILNIRVR